MGSDGRDSDSTVRPYAGLVTFEEAIKRTENALYMAALIIGISIGVAAIGLEITVHAVLSGMLQP